MIASRNNKRVSPNCFAFLQTFENGKLPRSKVYSFPALYRLMELGLVEFDPDGPAAPHNIYRLTEAGQKLVVTDPQ